MSIGLITRGLGGVAAAQRYAVETNSADTLRQRIVDVIATRLSTILIAEGYKTDAGKTVVAWSEHALAENKLPALTYRDMGNAPEQATVGRVDNFLTMEVGGIAVRDATGQAQMREIIADVLQMVGADETWSGLAFDTQIPSEDPDIIMLENGQFSAMITLTIEYNTERFNAYE